MLLAERISGVLLKRYRQSKTPLVGAFYFAYLFRLKYKMATRQIKTKNT